MDVDEFIKTNGNGTPKLKESPGIWKRIGGFVFDILLLNLVVFSALEPLVLKQISTSNFSFSMNIPFSVYIIMFVAGLFALAYFALLEYTLGATLGMMLFDISVDKSPGFWTCILRNIFVLPVFPFTLFWILDPIYLLWKKKRLLEEISGTETVILKNG